MYKLVFLFILFFNFNAFSTSIEVVRKNKTYLEALGVGGFGSINYERKIFQINYCKFNLRTGIGSFHLIDFENKLNPDFVIPLGIHTHFFNYYQLEVGLGQTLSSIVVFDDGKSRNYQFNTYFHIGLFKEFSSIPLFYKIAYTPIIEANKRYKHWGAISLGIKF